MPEADPNWLLSSAVQSGAALVAIVGGFVGARYVGLHSERLGAQRRAEDANARLVPARGELERAQETLTRFEVSEVLDRDDVFTAIMAGGKDAALDGVLAQVEADTDEVPEAALEAHFNLLKGTLNDAAQTMEPLIPVSEEQLSWEVFKRRHHIAPQHQAAWAWAYETLSERHQEAAKRTRRQAEQDKRRGSRWEGFPLRAPYEVPTIVPSALTGARYMASSTRSTAEHHRLLGIRDDARRRIAQLEAERDAAAAHFQSTAQPEGFGLALGVLAYLAVVTIAIPMAVMVGAPVSLPLWVRMLVAGLFLSGVATLLMYLRAYAAFLRDDTGTRSLPSTPLGLLRRRRPAPGTDST